MYQQKLQPCKACRHAEACCPGKHMDQDLVVALGIEQTLMESHAVHRALVIATNVQYLTQHQCSHINTLPTRCMTM